MTNYLEQKEKPPIIIFRKDGFIGTVIKKETDSHGNYYFEVVQAGSTTKIFGIIVRQAIYKIKNINPVNVRFIEPNDYSYTPPCGLIEVNADIKGEDFTGDDKNSQVQQRLSEALNEIQRKETRILELEEHLNITENSDKLLEREGRIGKEMKAIRKSVAPTHPSYGSQDFGNSYGGGQDYNEPNDGSAE